MNQFVQFGFWSQRLSPLGIIVFLCASASPLYAQQLTPSPEPSVLASPTPEDPCDPSKITFSAAQCKAQTRQRSYNAGIRYEYGYSEPIVGTTMNIVGDPVYDQGERLAFDWGLSKLVMDQAALSACYQGNPTPEQADLCVRQTMAGFRQKYKDFYKHVADAPLEVLEKELRADMGARAKNFSSDELMGQILVRKILSQDGPDQAKTMLQSEAQKISVRQRLAVIQRIGYYFKLRYDQGRNAEGISAKGSVSLADLLAYHRSIEIDRPRDLGSGFGFGVGYNPYSLGICRDIASAQGELLEAMGFKNTYVVSYFTTGTLHSTVFTENPDDHGRYYRINYFLMSTTPGSGPDMLYQDDGTAAQDVSLRYFINKPNGETVATVPSELSLLVTRALRGDDAMESLSPGYVPKGHLIAADLDFHRFRSWIEGRVFEGIDSRGQQYYGAGIILENGGEKSIYSQEIGASYVHRDAYPFITENLFAFYEGTLRTHDIYMDHARRMRIHGEVMLYLAGLFGVSKEPAQKDFLSLDGRLVPAIEADFGNSKEDRFSGRVKVGAQFTPGVGLITDVQTARMQLDQWMVEGQLFYFLGQTPQGRMELNKTPVGRAYLYAIATAIFDEWGERTVNRLGLNSHHTSVEVRYSGRVQEESPIFRAAAIKQMGLRLSQRFGHYTIVYGEMTQPLELKQFERVGKEVRVGAQIDVPWGPWRPAPGPKK